MTKEEWRPIEGYEGLYAVSNMGRVKSLNYHRTGKEQTLKPTKDKDGYLRIGLHKNGKVGYSSIHRLVAKAFIPNKENKPCIDHINTIVDDNRVENLRWCSQKENNANILTKKHHEEAVSKAEYKVKVSAVNKRINNDKGVKEKKSKISIKNWENPEYRKKVIDGLIKSSAKPVLQIDRETGEIIKEWISMAEAARALSIKYNNISQCCNGIKKTSGGYKWGYKKGA